MSCKDCPEKKACDAAIDAADEGILERIASLAESLMDDNKAQVEAELIELLRSIYPCPEED